MSARTILAELSLVTICLGALGSQVPDSAQAESQPSQSTAVSVSSPVHGVSIVPQMAGDLRTVNFRKSVLEAQDDGANTIDLVMQYEQSTLKSADIAPTAATPSKSDLAHAIAYIHGRGMRVALKFFFDTKQKSPKTHTTYWRNFIDPSNPQLWFQRATKLEVNAARLKPDLIIIGTEMGTLTTGNKLDKSFWQKLISSIRKVDPHQVTYEAQSPSNRHAYEEARRIKFWHSLDFMTFSGYNALSIPCPTAPSDSIAPMADAVAAQWASIDKQYYQPLEKLFKMRFMFGETGYSSFTCDHQAPWAYHGPGHPSSVDQTEQAADYAGFLQYWYHRPNSLGFIFWNWEPTPKPSSFFAADFTPQGKLAETIMKSVLLNLPDAVEVWWPKPTTVFTGQDGVQPFQAVIPNMPLNQYQITWSVDGGAQTVMSDATTANGIFEKEADVDLSTWTWDATGRYLVTFRATDVSGKVLGLSSVLVTIAKSKSLRGNSVEYK